MNDKENKLEPCCYCGGRPTLTLKFDTFRKVEFGMVECLNIGCCGNRMRSPAVGWLRVWNSKNKMYSRVLRKGQSAIPPIFVQV